MVAAPDHSGKRRNVCRNALVVMRKPTDVPQLPHTDSGGYVEGCNLNDVIASTPPDTPGDRCVHVEGCNVNAIIASTPPSTRAEIGVCGGE
jgi:hypothetical protein